MGTAFFKREDTKLAQNNVRALFKEMSAPFRDHLMRSFMWKQDKLEAYLNRDKELNGDELIDAYNHLDSLLTRIDSFAKENTHKNFPSYDEWVDAEYLKYKSDHQEDVDDIERLMDEGGVVAPGKTSPVDTMANDSLSHYNHLKDEYETVQSRAKEAYKLTNTQAYQALLQTSQEMNAVIVQGCRKKM